MKSKMFPQVLKLMRLRWWLLFSILVAVGSFSLLSYIVTNIWPNPNAIFAQPQLLLLSVLFVGATSAAIPVTAYLNYRFAKPDWLQRDKLRLLRQGIWIGLLGVLLAYIQLIRALNWAIALVLIGVFIFIEMFFLTRE